MKSRRNNSRNLVMSAGVILSFCMLLFLPVRAMAAETDELPESVSVEEQLPGDTDSASTISESVVLSEESTEIYLAAAVVNSDPAEPAGPADVFEPAPVSVLAQGQDAAGEDAAPEKGIRDALAVIYADAANVPRRKGNKPDRMVRDARYKDLLNGHYAEKAVELFLDHGYYLDKVQELREAGVLDDDYVVPEKPYVITGTEEYLRYPLPEDVFETHVIITDSVYLQTFQLEQIAAYHGFDEYAEYEEELEEFENTYIPKYEWG